MSGYPTIRPLARRLPDTSSLSIEILIRAEGVRVIGPRAANNFLTGNRGFGMLDHAATVV